MLILALYGVRPAAPVANRELMSCLGHQGTPYGVERFLGARGVRATGLGHIRAPTSPLAAENFGAGGNQLAASDRRQASATRAPAHHRPPGRQRRFRQFSPLGARRFDGPQGTSPWAAGPWRAHAGHRPVRAPTAAAPRPGAPRVPAGRPGWCAAPPRPGAADLPLPPDKPRRRRRSAPRYGARPRPPSFH